jgi:fibronectin type 3 domain-containing protein
MESKLLKPHGFAALFIISLFMGVCISCSLGGIGGDGSSNTSTPGAPTGVTVSGSTISTITVSWNAVSGASSYTVYYTEDGSSPVNNSSAQTETSNSSPLTFQPDASAYGLPINIAVTATNTNGEGSASAVVTGTTLVPTNVVATSVGGGSLKIKLSWTAVPNAVSYNVYHTYNSASGVTTNNPSKTSNSFSTTSPSATWTANANDANYYYHFAVTAIDAAGNEGGLSSTVTAQAN